MSGPGLAQGCEARQDLLENDSSREKAEYPPRPDDIARSENVKQDCQTQKPSKKKQISWDEYCGMRECADCVEEAKMRMKLECDECGDGIEEGELEMCILGLDVVGLFPAMKSKNSGH